MALDLCVGLFAGIEEPEDELDEVERLRTDFTSINTVLNRAGFPAHQEREDLPVIIADIELPWECRVGRYSALHFLRRLYAHILAHRVSAPSSPPVLPDPFQGSDAAEDPLLQRAYKDDGDRRSPFHASHLIQHSDAVGYYVPIDFPTPIGPYTVEAPALWEQLDSNLCSSFGLERECRETAAALGLDVASVRLDADPGIAFDALEAAANALPIAEQRSRGYRTEASVCWTLLHASRISLHTGLALAFV